MRRVRKALAALLFAAATIALLPGPEPAGAHSIPSDCPALTDSITRLYHAYLGRDPEPTGFEHWVEQYRTGAMSLEEISAAFERGPEFRARHLTDNVSFVTWLFRQLVGPEVSPTRSAQWVTALDQGMARGTMMLTFTESKAYVGRTSTAKPLAGYLRWYPKGTQWFCGRGGDTVPTQPLAGRLWADYFAENRGQTPDRVRLWTLEGIGHRHLEMADENLDPGASVYNPDGAFSGDGEYGRYLEVEAGAGTDWIVVFYPRSMGAVRSGWSLTP